MSCFHTYRAPSATTGKLNADFTIVAARDRAMDERTRADVPTTNALEHDNAAPL